MSFLNNTPTANFIFYRSYSRWSDGARETWNQMVDRCIDGLAELGQLDPDEIQLLYSQFDESTALPSGRYMWCGGTQWNDRPENFYGAYNCSSTEVNSWGAFGYMMDLAMQGTGTGANLEERNISQLPAICNQLKVEVSGKIGLNYEESGIYNGKKLDFSETMFSERKGEITIAVGDSRKGWVDSYQKLLELASDPTKSKTIKVSVDISFVRPTGAKLKGFGGIANPVKLQELYSRTAEILNSAIGRQLNSIECCLLIDEAAKVIVAGNVRRSAGIRMFSSDDANSATAKDNLWQQDKDGDWKIDPDRDALRMANHTRVFHTKPTLQECIDSVRKQYYSGEGAIQWAGEAVARSNVDLLDTDKKKSKFLKKYKADKSSAMSFLGDILNLKSPNSYGRDTELNHRMNRYGLNPCLDADTMILTRKGHFTIEELVGKVVEIWDGNEWVEIDNFRITGVNENLLTVSLSNDEIVRATPYHKFILWDGTEKLCKDLVNGDRLKTHSQQPDGQHIGRGQTAISVVTVEDYGLVDKVYCCTVPTNNRFALSAGILTGNCGEIIGSDFMCDLAEIHLNKIDPLNIDAQVSAFKAGSISVAVLLNHQFNIDRYAKSRELDPIVGVSFTGLFDFFVNLFGVEWLQWWQDGRPAIWGSPTDIRCDSRLRGLVEADFIRVFYFDSLSQMFLAIEEEYLCFWKSVVFDTVNEYCQRHNIKAPNRATTVQPSGSKALLTGASPGWHPPKASRYIRRMTFGKGEPIALAAINMGYSVVPSQSDKDENGNLLKDPFDPRCTEWLVEIPCETSWANLAGADEIEVGNFSAIAQYDFYMQVQKHYTTHNTSSTIELREHEIEPLANAIYNSIQSDKGYISSALLARFDSLETFPRMPFEPISKDVYADMMTAIALRSEGTSFREALSRHDRGQTKESGPSGCDSDRCLLSLPDKK